MKCSHFIPLPRKYVTRSPKPLKQLSVLLTNASRVFPSLDLTHPCPPHTRKLQRSSALTQLGISPSSRASSYGEHVCIVDLPFVHYSKPPEGRGQVLFSFVPQYLTHSRWCCWAPRTAQNLPYRRTSPWARNVAPLLL